MGNCSKIWNKKPFKNCTSNIKNKNCQAEFVQKLSSFVKTLVAYKLHQTKIKTIIETFHKIFSR